MGSVTLMDQRGVSEGKAAVDGQTTAWWEGAEGVRMERAVATDVRGKSTYQGTIHIPRNTISTAALHARSKGSRGRVAARKAALFTGYQLQSLLRDTAIGSIPTFPKRR